MHCCANEWKVCQMSKIRLENISYIYGVGTPYEICALNTPENTNGKTPIMVRPTAPMKMM